MTYLQLALAGVPAIVYQRDTLSMETWQRWETPAYIMQYLRFRKVTKKGYEWYPERSAIRNMDNKESLCRNVIEKMSPFLSSVNLNVLEQTLSIELHKYDISIAENALSTHVEHPNERYLKQFLAIKKVSGLSPNSLKAYNTEITMMFNYLGKHISEITTNDIRYYLAMEQTDKELSSCYLDTKRRYMRTFFKTLRKEGLIQSDPTERIDKIKSEKKIKKAFSEMEIEMLRKEASKNIRTKALFEFLLSTGCRVSECSSSNRDDIRIDKLIITGKGNKQRYVYLTTKAQLALQEYFSSRKDDNEAMFVSNKSKEGSYNRLEKGCIEKIIRDLGKSAGIEECHPHKFRRTTATTALRNGMPIEQVSKMLGHEELNTTQIYARSDETDVYAAHKKYVGR